MVLAPVVVESGYVGRISKGGGVFLYHLGWCVLVSYRPTIYLPRSQQG